MASSERRQIDDGMASGAVTLVSKLETLTKWLLSLAGVCYASGFLVVYTFLGHFKTRDHGTDFLKLKYIYVGILCWLFPAGFFLPLGALYELNRTMKRETAETTKQRWQLLTSMFFALFVPVVVYFMVEFANPSNTLPAWWIACSMAMAFVGYWCLDAVKDAALRRWIRYAIAALISCSFFILGRHFIWYVLTIVFWKKGYIYIVFVVSAISIFPRTRHWTKGLGSNVGRHAWIISITLSVLLMYLAILSYAAWVYPYVPATRGGGDYATLSDAIIQLRDNDTTAKCGKAEGSNDVRCLVGNERVKIIDETEDTLFVASIHSGGGPAAWRQWPSNEKELGNIPVVVEIPRAEVMGIIYCKSDESKPCGAN